ncbi:uncharacterized protein [Hemitrygon akajei]|uniref:uncharacterized protein isoform X1 n=1 Tax=Hemitrygon akajei TaxID=2704970 RepID=UPI003BFA1879
MAACGTDGLQEEGEQILQGIVTQLPSSLEPPAQCHRSNPQPIQRESREETPGGVNQHLHHSIADTSASDLTNLLALFCQERMPLLIRALEWKRQQVRRKRELLKERELQVLSARYPVKHPLAQTEWLWSEVQAVKTRLVELQMMYEEEAVLNAQLHEVVQRLTQQMEREEARHTQDLLSMGEQIERSKLGVWMLEEHMGTNDMEEALKIIHESWRSMVEFEKKAFQENIAQTYDQSLVTLNALRTSNQLLVKEALSERQQLRRCSEVLSDHARALRCKVQCEETQCRMLAETLEQERSCNQYYLRALEQRCQGLWQHLRGSAETDHGSLAGGMEADFATVESRTAKEDCSQVRGPSPPESESEGNPEVVARGLLDPSLSATDFLIPRDLAAEEKQSPSRLMAEQQPPYRKGLGVRIKQVDRRGRFVQLYNPSHLEDVDMGGCLLQQSVAGHLVSLYRFPRGTNIPVQDHLRVWAAVPDHSTKRRTDVVWDELQRFRSGGDCTTTLRQPDGQVITQYIPSHRLLAAVNIGDDSEDWVYSAWDTQQAPSAASSQRWDLREDERDSGHVDNIAHPSVTGCTEHQDSQKRDRSVSAWIRSVAERPESNGSSLSEWSCLWSRASVDSNVRSYVPSSLRSLPPDSLPALTTPASPSPPSATPTPRLSTDAERPESVVCALQLARIRSLTGRMTERNARPRFGLRFMSHPPITTDFRHSRR